MESLADRAYAVTCLTLTPEIFKTLFFVKNILENFFTDNNKTNLGGYEQCIDDTKITGELKLETWLIFVFTIAMHGQREERLFVGSLGAGILTKR